MSKSSYLHPAQCKDMNLKCSKKSVLVSSNPLKSGLESSGNLKKVIFINAAKTIINERRNKEVISVICSCFLEVVFSSIKL